MKTLPRISIIIPALNEELLIRETLSSLRLQDCELIMVDGGSMDNTVGLACEKGARVLSSEPGRGRQLNKGAAAARGEILLFLHADTTLPQNFQPLVTGALKRKGAVAGAFRLGIDAGGARFRLLEKGAALRSLVLGLPYGDQAIFLRRETFEEIGGFPEQEIMEDVSLVRKLAEKGKIEILPESVLTSGRRWHKRGVAVTTLLNQLLLCGFFLGLSPRFLARCYYGRKHI